MTVFPKYYQKYLTYTNYITGNTKNQAYFLKIKSLRNIKYNKKNAVTPVRSRVKNISSAIE